METVIAIGLFLLFGAVVFWIVRFFWRLVVGMWRLGTTPTNQQPVARNSGGLGEMTAEEEGNVHSGPYGYSPNMAYPETQYGSLFDPDAEWNHEERD